MSDCPQPCMCPTCYAPYMDEPVALEDKLAALPQERQDRINAEADRLAALREKETTMSDDDLIRREDIGPHLAIAGFGGKALQDAIAELPAVTVRYTQADIGKIAAIIAEDDPFGAGAAAIAKAGCILAALDVTDMTEPVTHVRTASLTFKSTRKNTDD